MTDEICLVGFGAIGALYACALERSSRAKITSVCRSNYQTMHEHGLMIVSDCIGTIDAWRPHRVVRSVAEAADRQYSFIVCATKCVPEVKKTTDIILPLLATLSSSSDTTIVLLQNGIGIEDDILDWLDEHNQGNTVISGCAWVDTTMIDGGKKVTQHGNEKLVLGYHRPQASHTKYATRFSKNTAIKQLDVFCDLLRAGSTNPEAAEDIDIARWRKVLWNASFSTVCTLTRANVGEVLATPTARTLLVEIMLEVLLVARASLPPSPAVTDILSDSVCIAIIEHENQKSVFKPSMLVDLEAGRPMEVEAIVGGVLKRAKAAGIAAPKLEVIYAGLNVIQRGLLGDRQ